MTPAIVSVLTIESYSFEIACKATGITFVAFFTAHNHIQYRLTYAQPEQLFVLGRYFELLNNRNEKAKIQANCIQKSN